MDNQPPSAASGDTIEQTQTPKITKKRRTYNKDAVVTFTNFLRCLSTRHPEWSEEQVGKNAMNIWFRMSIKKRLEYQVTSREKSRMRRSITANEKRMSRIVHRRINIKDRMAENARKNKPPRKPRTRKRSETSVSTDAGNDSREQS